MKYKRNFKPGELFNEHKAMAMGKKKAKKKLSYSQYKPVQSFGKRPTRIPNVNRNLNIDVKKYLSKIPPMVSPGFPSPKPGEPTTQPVRGISLGGYQLRKSKKRNKKKVKHAKKKAMRCKLKHKHDKSCM